MEGNGYGSQDPTLSASDSDSLQLAQPWSWSWVDEAPENDNYSNQGSYDYGYEEKEDNGMQKMDLETNEEDPYTLDLDDSSPWDDSLEEAPAVNQWKRIGVLTPDQLARKFDEIRNERGPHWNIGTLENKRYVTMDDFFVQSPLQKAEWENVQMGLEVISNRSAAENERGRTVALFCTVPGNLGASKWRIGLALYAAHLADDIFQNESGEIRYALQEQRRNMATALTSLTSKSDLRLGILDQWYIYDDDGDLVFEYTPYEATKRRNTRFIVYILGAGDINSEKLAEKRKALTGVLQKTRT